MKSKKSKINCFKSWCISLSKENEARFKQYYESYSSEYKREQKANLNVNLNQK